ncbi:hypothetical protein BCU94_18795 [Shewanella sp. 10N.286.52.C2]|nr:hypothetical protein BCU94_18795 [Shewanella sp. 10N.286.52.C2]PMH85240.1 hypothetical protein BCU57_15175 [Shewanella sp. 10N.286.48.B5]PMI02110.1 hypothetical protein BCU55_08025 [Shewanella sp. 10N.286.48.A6]
MSCVYAKSSHKHLRARNAAIHQREVNLHARARQAISTLVMAARLMLNIETCGFTKFGEIMSGLNAKGL